MIKRRESEQKRYQEYYGVEQTDEFNYDLVLDTTDFPPETIVMEIMDFIKAFQ